MTDVVLLGFPVELFERTLEHQAGLRREFDVIRMRGAADTDVPDALEALLAQLQTGFSGYGAAMDILREAVAGREPEVDVVIPVPAGDDGAAADGVDQLRNLMHAVDAYCREGDVLLTVAAPPELVAFRDWFLGEIVGQLRGASPRRWSEFVLEHHPEEPAEVERPATVGTVRLAEGWSIDQSDDRTVLRVSGALDLDVAAALRDALRHLETQGEKTITVDLRSVGFIDSVGLSVLVAAHTHCVDRGVRFDLVLPSRLERLFEIAGLRDVLNVTVEPEQ